MATESNSRPRCEAPSTKECIAALRERSELFKTIAQYPEAAIHERFREEWARAIAYIESKIHRYMRAADASLRQDVSSDDVEEDIYPEEPGHTKAMDALVDSLLLHCRIIESFQKMSMAPQPSKAMMHLYRTYNGDGRRAANGEMASLYGHIGQPIPNDLATAESDDLEPMARFIRDFLMDLVVKYIVQPSKVLLHVLPIYHRKPTAVETDVEYVHRGIVTAVANASVYVLAILVLIAPIATFTVVQEQKSRIVVMPLFCLLLTASAQLMGTRSMPVFSLVTAYFQAMVVFVTITKDWQVTQ